MFKLYSCGALAQSKFLEIYQRININWSNVTISLVDRVVVGKSHQDSNEKLVNDLLMVSEAKSAKFISICNESKQLLNINRPYSVMLLGMGEDGHFIIISSANSIKSRIF